MKIGSIAYLDDLKKKRKRKQQQLYSVHEK